MIPKKVFFLFVFSIFLQFAHAQRLYVPRDVQKAYHNGTRSVSGRPGPHYWQNKGIYDITVTALPPDRNIQGTETIIYINNSPDTLKSLNLKLILNIHKPGAPRFAGVKPDYLTPGVVIDSFSINGSAISINTTESFTNKKITLNTPLMPKSSVKLIINWHYLISLSSNREGMIDSTTYFLAYFYPRIAVFDDYTGWDKLEFTEAAEFYNDFNDYTLHVRVPRNFIVWATGTLQNDSVVLQPEYLKRLRQSFTSDSVIQIISKPDLARQDITAAHDVNTWNWAAKDISDMAIGISDHYLWDAASIVVDRKTNRKASMQAAYQSKSVDYRQSVQLGLHSLGWLSTQLPGIPYPYPKMTSFQGFADQEYPMMCNDVADDPRFTQQFTQDHEIAHSYFPFYMGVNESRYPFMDEGWATAIELLMGRDEIGISKADELFKSFRVNDYIHNNSTSMDLPLIIPASELSASPGGGLGYNAYTKPALSYLALQDMLGNSLFKTALHYYMQNWHGKHPIPWDFFYSMSSGSGKNLDWFFTNWFFTNNYIDLALTALNKTRVGYLITIENIGGFAIPFDIKATCKNGSIQTWHYTPGIWEMNQKRLKLNLKTQKAITKISVETGVFVDADGLNNNINLK